MNHTDSGGHYFLIDTHAAFYYIFRQFHKIIEEADNGWNLNDS